jgi:toxin FitB
MSFLLDTNAVSEWVKPTPDPGLTSWLAATDEDRMHLSVVTLAELRHGIERLVIGRRRSRLEQWLDLELPDRFAGRVLVVDEVVARGWGRLMAHASALGRPIGVMDGFIAATAEAASLTLVTRNVADFAVAGIPLHNPWTS